MHPAFVGYSYRVTRIGTWNGEAECSLVGVRDPMWPDYAPDYLGFRAVLPPGSASAP